MSFSSLLKVLTLNVRGLASDWARLKLCYDDLPSLGLYVLTETNLDQATLDTPNYLPPGGVRAFTTRHPTKLLGSGVTLLVGSDLEVVPESFSPLLPGFLATISFSLAGTTYLVFGVYSPSNDAGTTRHIQSCILDEIESRPHTHVLVVGDLNASLRALDRPNQRARPTQHERLWRVFREDLDLTDIIALKHPQSSLYTYHRTNARSSIDHILVSRALSLGCRRADVPGSGLANDLDHFPVIGIFALANNTPPSHTPTVNRVPTADLADIDLQDMVDGCPQR